MARKRKPPVNGDLAKDLWINPRSNLRGPDGNRAWESGGNIPPSSGNRFLELADIALGLKSPETKKRKITSKNSGSDKAA
jgi:hypothetical protein